MLVGSNILRIDCEAWTGHPQCMGCAGGGPHYCTCPTLKKVEHTLAKLRSWRALQRRGFRKCDDCAFRPDSPERDEDDELLWTKDIPFRCHKGMPLDARGLLERPKEDRGRLNYCPQIGGRETREAVGYAICVGWLFTYGKRGGPQNLPEFHTDLRKAAALAWVLDPCRRLEETKTTPRRTTKTTT